MKTPIRTTKQIKLSQIQPHPENPNQGDAGAILESLNVQFRAIGVSEATGNIVYGNHTYLAAEMKGESTILAHLLPDLTPEDELRILLADNQYARKATSDDVTLAELLLQLSATDGKLEGTGYDGDDLDQLLTDLDAKGERGDGHVPDPPRNPKAKDGDRYQVGDHVVVCGDATDPAAYGDSFDLLWTDPPYGVSYAEKNAHLNRADRVGLRTTGGGGNRLEQPIEADHQNPEEMKALWTSAFTTAREHAQPHAAYYTTGPQGGELLMLLMQSIIDSGWQLKHTLIWAKSSHVLGRADYHYQHEPILYGWNKKHKWYGDRSQFSLRQHDRPLSNDLHPTMKPLELIEPMIRNSTKPGMLVCDPFAGSGSTLIAAHNTERKAHLIERDPAYVDVIIERFIAAEPGTKVKKL